MTSLVEKIRSRGYWHVIVRPVAYVPERVSNILALHPIVEQNRVRFRGWDYPHVDTRQGSEVHLDWVGQETEWEHYLAAWRLYQSGQFVHLMGISDDWRDQSTLWPYNRGIPGQRGWPSPPGWEQGLHLGTAGTVAEYTETFEFAARLAVSAVGDERMYVEVTLKGLRNRELYVDDPGKVPFHWQRAANIDEFPFQIELSRAELVARSRDLALEAAQKLYRYFQWDVGIDLLRGLQGEFIRS